jgi:hypothetical protein
MDDGIILAGRASKRMGPVNNNEICGFDVLIIKQLLAFPYKE